MRALWLLCLLLAIPAIGWAKDFRSSASGMSTAAFLKLGAGARAAGLGEAYSAAVNEPSALYWNPAALTRIEKRAATFTHAAHIASSFFDYAAYAHNLGRFGALGVGVQYYSTGKITETNDIGLETGSFTPYDLALSLGYARRFESSLAALNGISVGVAMKTVHSRIVNTAQTIAGDAGILSPAYFGGRLRLALSAANIGGKMKFESDSEELPLIVRAGSAFHIHSRWLITADAISPRDEEVSVGVGTEYRWAVAGDWTLAGRTGFNSRTLHEIDGFTGVSFGFGLDNNLLGFDYAFVPLGGVGMNHRFSVSMKF